MSDSAKKQINWPLLIPLGLLAIEIIVVLALYLFSVELNQNLIFFFSVLAIYLVYNVLRQLYSLYRAKFAVSRSKKAEQYAEAGQWPEAVKLWKKLLLNLPREEYLATIEKLQNVYRDLGMSEGVRQTKALHAESMDFFTLLEKTEEPTGQDRRKWQIKAQQLQNSIKALPEVQK